MEKSVTCAICGVTGPVVLPIGGHAICPECQRLLDDPVNRVLTQPDPPGMPETPSIR